MNICIVGVGNIGMRYVQGITKLFPDAQLFLVDRAARIRELKRLELGNVRLLTTVEDMHESLDLCVVATSCVPRLSIYKRCLALKPKYIILEKYLFNSREEFEECLRLERVPTFVNQWMFGSKAFDRLFETEATTVELAGSGWGLACNAVHWIDVFQRHLNITDLHVGHGTTISKVVSSKRDGYEDILGKLVFIDKCSDKSFSLIDSCDEIHVDELGIKVDERSYVFDYSTIKRHGEVLSHFPFFSELIGKIVGDILQKSSCSLPLLESSISQHLLVEEILETVENRPKIT